MGFLAPTINSLLQSCSDCVYFVARQVKQSQCAMCASIMFLCVSGARPHWISAPLPMTHWWPWPGATPRSFIGALSRWQNIFTIKYFYISTPQQQRTPGGPSWRNWLGGATGGWNMEIWTLQREWRREADIDIVTFWTLKISEKSLEGNNNCTQCLLFEHHIHCFRDLSCLLPVIGWAGSKEFQLTNHRQQKA